MWIRDAFRRVEYGTAPPPIPPEISTFVSQTSYAALGGFMIGGYRGIYLARDKTLKSPVPTHTPGHRAAVFFVNEGLSMGGRMGGFVALFSLTALLAAEARAAMDPSKMLQSKEDACDLGCAGGVTGLILGARGFGAIRGAGFGALFGGFGGALKGVIEGVLREHEEKLVVADDEAEEKEEEIGSVKRVVQMYEERLMQGRPGEDAVGGRSDDQVAGGKL